MGITLTRSRATALGLRPSKRTDFATEVDELVASAAPTVAEERREVGATTYSLVRADGRGDTLLDVLQSEKRRGRKKSLIPEEEEFLERRLGAVVRERPAGDVEVEFFIDRDEMEERWRAIRVVGERAEQATGKGAP